MWAHVPPSPANCTEDSLTVLMSRSPVVSKSGFYLQIHLKAWHQSKNWSERGKVRRRELQSGIPWPPSQWTPCFHTPFSYWVPHACFLESVVARLPLSKGDFHVFTGQRRQLVLLCSILHSRFYGKVNSSATDCRVLVPTPTLQTLELFQNVISSNISSSYWVYILSENIGAINT